VVLPVNGNALVVAALHPVVISSSKKDFIIWVAMNEWTTYLDGARNAR
jgi:hypothetical protein